MTTPTTNSGLEDVVVSTSEICFIDGDRGRLLYRGYDIHDLVAHSSFEETAALLWNGVLPTSTELERLRKALAMPRAEVIATVLARLDDEHGRDGRDGAVGWLRANGLDDATLERLRARLTDR